VSNDALRHEFDHVMDLVQNQMRDLASLKERQDRLSATVAVADGMVAVTMNGQRVITDTVIDESFFDDYELNELGGFVTRAAQAAAREVERRVMEMVAPLSDRRQELMDASAHATDVPEMAELFSQLKAFTPSRQADGQQDDDGGDDVQPVTTLRG
jgi:DNA-binding protein YbaB